MMEPAAPEKTRSEGAEPPADFKNKMELWRKKWICREKNGFVKKKLDL